MKSMYILLCLIGFATIASAQQRTHTMTLVVGTNQVGNTNTLQIKQGDSVELVSWILDYGQLAFEKDGRRYSYAGDSFSRLILAGPTTIYLYSTFAGPRRSWATFVITPDAFPPERTVIIPAGAAGAEVTIEYSTNLTQWVTATNGVYTGTNGAKFFRIRADRLP